MIIPYFMPISNSISSSGVYVELNTFGVIIVLFIYLGFIGIVIYLIVQMFKEGSYEMLFLLILILLILLLPFGFA